MTGIGPSARNLFSQRKKYWPLADNPAPFDAGVRGQHAVRDISHGYTRANAPIAKVFTPSELYIPVFSGLPS